VALLTLYRQLADPAMLFRGSLTPFHEASVALHAAAEGQRHGRSVRGPFVSLRSSFDARPRESAALCRFFPLRYPCGYSASGGGECM
jgi:hypothetical protein